MTINKTGRYWKGTDFADLDEYLRALTHDSYPASRVVQSLCDCGSKGFNVDFDGEEGGAQRTCVDCGVSAFIADSEDYWADATPQRLRCACRSTRFEVGVGFSLRDGSEVRWVSVGARCLTCGTLGAPAGWKIDYSPSAHLTSQA